MSFCAPPGAGGTGVGVTVGMTAVMVGFVARARRTKSIVRFVSWLGSLTGALAPQRSPRRVRMSTAVEASTGTTTWTAPMMVGLMASQN